MTRCGEYLGDNDATCPQLTCVREKGHAGLCDNRTDEEIVEATPIEHKVYVVLLEVDRAPLVNTWIAADGAGRILHMGTDRAEAIVDAGYMLGGQRGGKIGDEVKVHVRQAGPMPAEQANELLSDMRRAAALVVLGEHKA